MQPYLLRLEDAESGWLVFVRELVSWFVGKRARFASKSKTESGVEIFHDAEIFLQISANLDSLVRISCFLEGRRGFVF
jgi:hypothetical protein